MDIDAISPGEDFFEVIEKTVGECDVLIAVIGEHWLAMDEGGNRRLDNPDDLVRMEIAPTPDIVARTGLGESGRRAQTAR
jgi:hypothetical protein